LVEELPLYKDMPPFFDVYASSATWKPSTSCLKATLFGLVKLDSVAPNLGLIVGKLQTTKSSMV